MGVKTFIAKQWAKRRAKKIYKVAGQAVASQQKTLKWLLQKAKTTQFGQAHRFSAIHTYKGFKKAVPLRDYEYFRDWLNPAYEGEKNVSWPGQALYFCKTSGTTSGMKYIPITKHAIRMQIRAARDALLMYIYHSGKADFLNGKMMFLSGSPSLEENQAGIKTGRLSGIVNHFVPGYLRSNQVPTYQTNCIEDWEQKIEAILQETMPQDLRLASGIPPWLQMLFERQKALSGKDTLTQWPNLSLYVHGGVNFEPYKPIFDTIFQGKVALWETYPASEGFFAFQDHPHAQGLLLNLESGIFFEFVPLEKYGQSDAPRLALNEVVLHTQYVLIVSTSAGLWAYDTGDTVKFTSLAPPRIQVTGRVKHFISAFGEHVIAEEVNKAMQAACAQTENKVVEFTLAPFIDKTGREGCHEWYVELAGSPKEERGFARALDEQLQQYNSYYADLRKGNILSAPAIYLLQPQSIRQYMKSIGKLGGQNKFPRLSNDRKIATALQPFIRQKIQL